MVFIPTTDQVNLHIFEIIGQLDVFRVLESIKEQSNFIAFMEAARTSINVDVAERCHILRGLIDGSS